MVFLPIICASSVECESYSLGVMLKKLIRQSLVANKSSGYQTYACGLFFSQALILKKKYSFLGGPYLPYANHFMKLPKPTIILNVVCQEKIDPIYLNFDLN
jgi:hypothetical protein